MARKSIEEMTDAEVAKFLKDRKAQRSSGSTGDITILSGRAADRWLDRFVGALAPDEPDDTNDEQDDEQNDEDDEEEDAPPSRKSTFSDRFFGQAS